MIEVTPNTVVVRVVPFPLQHGELCEIGIPTNPNKTVVLPPNGHVPARPQVSHFWGGIGVRVAEEGGEKVVGLPISNDAFICGSQRLGDSPRDGAADQLARNLPRMPDKQSADLIATRSLVQRASYIQRDIDPDRSCDYCSSCPARGRFL